jgi:hypothetical protein
MSDNKWVRSISFNKKNPQDIERLKLIGKKSFSRYVKRLLDDEIKRQSIKPNDIQVAGPTRLILKSEPPKTINPMLGGVANDR